ncbi:GFA family protein [Rhizobium sp. LjRoot98]|uniref:GFA family protein n=1 Tax=unclassified Rhizobium TaxID=2613769 RepID=UPI000713ECEE|nr:MULTISPECIES: GFA family protein [unclassified Rhizobium]KQV31419.1 aldehyde-activating protein [Rhizobium sp. Root1204]KQY10629.1 aldehyde-activating protein [Rhizobium sp. Root1334]KRC04624.1 aldehyde-activating protein [Rhizobium sp. Root73]
MAEENTGSCNCGSVRFRTRGTLREVIACHCSQCRKQTGLYYAATNVLDSELALEGAESITWYRSSPQARRGFCKTCGSALFWKMDSLDYTSIMAGAFDTPTGLSFGVHIFCADKGDFYEINDDLPQFAQSSA